MIRFVFLIFLALLALPGPVSGQNAASYAIQVNLFKDFRNAEKQTELLKEKGLDAFWKEEKPAGKAKRYIVYIGNYESRDQAREAANRLKQEGVFPDYSIKTLSLADQGKPPRSQEKSVPQEAEPSLVISHIAVKLKTPGKEAVLIQGNGPFTPSAFAIEEDKPRFVIDIKEARPVKRELSRIAADGQFIKRIRSFYHQENRTLRVVLDLSPSKSYRISQFFYQAQNLYAVEVEAE